MTNPSPSDQFNLIDEPWIKVLDHEGHVTEVSLRAALIDAHEYRCLAGELPTQDFAILRLLLSIVYPTCDFDPDEGIDEWSELWSSGKLPQAEIETYLDKWRPRFDLLHPEHPFMQVPDLRTSKGEWKGVDVLVPDCPGPGALFNRRSLDPISYAEAARWLVHAMAYDISGIKSGAVGDERVKGGKGYPMGIGWAGWLGGLTVEGDTLAQTLLLNTIADSETAATGKAIWEKTLTAAPQKPGDIEPGQITLFTWPQRRLRLHAANGKVSGALVCNGDPIDYTAQLRVETMTPWRYSEPQSKKAGRDVYMPRALQRDRAMWRGLESLLPNPTPPKVKGRGGEVAANLPAAVILWAQRLINYGVLDSNKLLRVKGVSKVYGAQNSSVDHIVTDSLVMPAALVGEQFAYLRAVAIAAVVRADQAVRALSDLADNLATAAGGERGTASERARSDAFARIDGLYRDWLIRLTPDTDSEKHLAYWTDSIRAITTQLGRSLIDQVPSTAWAGRTHNSHHVNIGQSWNWFERALNKALPRTLQPTATKGPQQ